MARRQFPTVVIVGRTNVGKSTLFNCLSSEVKSIVFDQHGVTRDVVKEIVSWQGRTFELIDTGGVSFGKLSDPLMAEARDRAYQAIQEAALILFVVDGSVGMLPEDREIVKKLHKQEAKVVVVVNKTDVRVYREYVHEFLQIGCAKMVEIAALHSKNIVEILETIVEALPESTPLPPEDDACKIVLLGKPNVGKSSLLNLLVEYERSIVSNIPGTTREPIRERIVFYQEDIILTDTAGVRKKRSVDEGLEQLMAKSTLRAVKDADIVLLMIDASEGTIADQELKLAFYAFEDQQKALVLLFNKQDLLIQDVYAQEQLESESDRYKFLLDHVEKLSISCITKQNVGKILPLVAKMVQRYKQQFSIEELTILFKEALERHPLYKNQQRLIVHRAQQIKSAPIIIALYVNNPPFFGPSQCAYFEHQMRKVYDLKGIPVTFVIRKR